VSDAHREEKATLRRLQDLTAQIEAAHSSQQVATTQLAKAKQTTKRVKKTVKLTVAQLRRELKKKRVRTKPKHR
jgi:phosphatidate phosphatase PAH1